MEDVVLTPALENPLLECREGLFRVYGSESGTTYWLALGRNPGSLVLLRAHGCGIVGATIPSAVGAKLLIYGE
jgi:hypothetical protein